jgi:hypothetical protein
VGTDCLSEVRASHSPPPTRGHHHQTLMCSHFMCASYAFLMLC